MALRDEIAEIIQVTDIPWVAADEIIDIIRDAMLAPPSVSEIAYQILVAEHGTGVKDGVLLSPTPKHEVQARMAMTAALAAAITQETT